LGGLGFVSVRDEYAIQSIIHAFRNITCSDDITRDLTLINLRNTIARYYETDNDWSIYNCLTWLNKGDQENGYKSWWTKIRNSIRYLDSIGLQIRFAINELRICLKVHTTSDSLLISQANLSTISFEIHKIYGRLKLEIWSRQKMAGVSATALAESKVSMAVLHNTEISNEEWRFLHAARTNSLPKNFIPNKPASETRCRGCGTKAEKQVHVFCLCHRNGSMILARHNAIQTIFMEALLTEKTDS